MKRFAQLIGLLLFIINPSLTSAQDYELDVTMGNDGMPSEFFYADKRMSVRITVDVPLIDIADGPWTDNTATVDVIIDEAFDPQILSSKSFSYWVLGMRIPLDPNQAYIHGIKQVELKTPYHLIIRGLKLRGIRWCELKIVQASKCSKNAHDVPQQVHCSTLVFATALESQVPTTLSGVLQPSQKPGGSSSKFGRSSGM